MSGVAVMTALLMLQTETDPASTVTTATVPPTVIAKNICEYVEAGPTGQLTLMVVLRLQESVNGSRFQAPPQAATRLVSIRCGMGSGATVERRNNKCVGAYLVLDGLLNGQPLGLNEVVPLEKAADEPEFRIVERKGSVFRLRWDMTENGTTFSATIIADLASGTITYSKHAAFLDRSSHERALARCEVNGWAGDHPVKAHGEN